MARRLRDLVITEVSSVDKGAGEGVKVLLMKRDVPADGDHVIDFAKLLRVTKSAAPDAAAEIAKASVALAKVIGDVLADNTITDKAKAIGAAFGEFQGYLTRKVTQQETDMDEKAIQALVAKAVGDAVAPLQATIAKQADELAFQKLTDAERKYCDDQKMDDAAKKGFAAKTPDERKAAMTKRVDDPNADLDARIQKAVQPIVTENAELKKKIEGYETERAVASFKKRATDAGLTEADGEVMRKAYGGDADAQVALEKRFTEVRKARDEALRAGRVLDELGHTGAANDAGADGMAKMNKLAEDFRKTEAGKSLTQAQAFDKVFNDPANAELRKEIRGAEITKIQKAAA